MLCSPALALPASFSSWLLEEVVRDEPLVAPVVEEALSARKEESAPTSEPFDLFPLAVYDACHAQRQ